MEEVMFENKYKVGIPNKNKTILTEECLKSMSEQVAKAYNEGNPKKLTISTPEDYNDCFTVKPQDIIADVKVFEPDYTIVEVKDCKKELLDELINYGYSPGYRMSCKVDIVNENGTRVVKDPRLICFDMINNRA